MDLKNGPSIASCDPRLTWLIEAWPTLTEDTRNALVELSGVLDDPAEDSGDETAAASAGGEAVAR
jgi:hypothetical protein